MTIAVGLGRSGKVSATMEDGFYALQNEQKRLSKELMSPSSRMIDDPAQVLIYVINGLQFPTYMKRFISGSTLTYGLFYRDNNNAEQQLATAAANGSTSPTTGKYFVGKETASGDVTIDPATGNILVGATIAGTIRFESAGGLTLAAINTRIADINAAIEGLSKVLSVSANIIDSALAIIR